jgi:hypothetical protein
MKSFWVLVSGLFLATSLPSLAYAQNITKYNNRAAFLADTGATSATGALPNVGRVIDIAVNPLGTYTLGSVTLALTTGSDDIAVGAAGTPAAPDWYLPTPGNDIALGFERMQVSTAAPVFSFGFDFVEPNTTMPPWGGTPVESTYEILLFNGPDLVGQVEFAGTAIPNDVVTFMGVWSDKAFNRVLINDITGDDDDEYFGEFYTGTTPAGCTLNLGLSYSGSTLSMNFEIGTAVPATWNVWLTYGTSSLISVLSIPIPAVTGVVLPVMAPLSSLGNIGILTTLNTASKGIACSAFKTVNTTP